ncbi:unnamed protein product [Brugia pahangi]|uniref:DDE Tnp4 domain-containing protein n=1 Tax=Brugia pahangi TaxID=6280 RepID=A0A0N4TJK0_BRUPA|nr:unnamed protein product [Brugia pahangi]
MCFRVICLNCTSFQDAFSVRYFVSANPADIIHVPDIYHGRNETEKIVHRPFRVTVSIDYVRLRHMQIVHCNVSILLDNLYITVLEHFYKFQLCKLRRSLIEKLLTFVAVASFWRKNDEGLVHYIPGTSYKSFLSKSIHGIKACFNTFESVEANSVRLSMNRVGDCSTSLMTVRKIRCDSLPMVSVTVIGKRILTLAVVCEEQDSKLPSLSFTSHIPCFLTSILYFFISDLKFPHMASNAMDLKGKQEMFKNSCFITQLVALSVSVAQRAGNIIKEWAFSGTGKSYYKGPVNLRDLYTDADIAAEDCIISSLHKHFGNNLKVIGEENTEPVGTSVVNNFDSSVLVHDSKCSDEVRQITSDDVCFVISLF